MQPPTTGDQWWTVRAAWCGWRHLHASQICRYRSDFYHFRAEYLSISLRTRQVWRADAPNLGLALTAAAVSIAAMVATSGRARAKTLRHRQRAKLTHASQSLLTVCVRATCATASCVLPAAGGHRAACPGSPRQKEVGASTTRMRLRRPWDTVHIPYIYHAYAVCMCHAYATHMPCLRAILHSTLYPFRRSESRRSEVRGSEWRER